MGVFESFRTQAKETETTAKSEKEDEPTLKEILANKQDETNFGIMLEKAGPDGLEVADLVAHPDKMEKGDLKRIGQFVKKFNAQMASADLITGEVSAETIADFAKGSPELQVVIELGGKEETAQVIEKLMRRVSVEDPERFKKIMRNYNTYKNFETRESKRLNDEFEALCKQNNINMSGETFAKIMQNPDKKTRYKELRAEVKKSFGFWRTTLNFVSGGYISRSITGDFEPRSWGASRRDDLLKTKAGVEKRMQTLGKQLGLMFDENPEVRSAIMDEISGQKTKGPEAGLKDLKGTMPTDKEVDDAWKQHIAKVNNWQNKSQAEKQATESAFKSDFLSGREQTYKQKGESAWTRMFVALIEMFLGNKNLV